MGQFERSQWVESDDGGAAALPLLWVGSRHTPLKRELAATLRD
jgi:hypothetical protein